MSSLSFSLTNTYAPATSTYQRTRTKRAHQKDAPKQLSTWVEKFEILADSQNDRSATRASEHTLLTVALHKQNTIHTWAEHCCLAKKKLLI